MLINICGCAGRENAMTSTIMKPPIPPPIINGNAQKLFAATAVYATNAEIVTSPNSASVLLIVPSMDILSTPIPG